MSAYRSAGLRSDFNACSNCARAGFIGGGFYPRMAWSSRSSHSSACRSGCFIHRQLRILLDRRAAVRIPHALQLNDVDFAAENLRELPLQIEILQTELNAGQKLDQEVVVTRFRIELPPRRAPEQRQLLHPI